MKYLKSKKYDNKLFMSKIMGPNPIKIAEELLTNNLIKPNSVIMDLGSGQGVSSVFISREYGYKVYATDLWSNPDDNSCFFESLGINANDIIPIKADANNLPFAKDFFDAAICIDAYNFFGREESFIDEKILPFIKNGGYIYLAISGVKQDFNGDYPKEILLSWTKEQMEYIKDINYWKNLFEKSKNIELIEISEMEGNDEFWTDWVKTDNQYAISDRKSIDAGALNHLNFIKVVLQKK